MSATLLEVVEHYQKKVERYNDEEKILHCFGKLQKLPITLEVLSKTGVGKTVNAFRRDPGPVGLKSRELVSKWKRIFEENEKKERIAQQCRERADGGGSGGGSPAASDASDERMEIDESRLAEQQREEEQREAEAEAARRQAEAEAEAEEREAEKRRKREERARREEKEAARDAHKKEKDREREKERHRKESKHRKHGEVRENGHSAEPPEERHEHKVNGRTEPDRSHHKSGSSKHSSSSHSSSGAGHSSSHSSSGHSSSHSSGHSSGHSSDRTSKDRVVSDSPHKSGSKSSSKSGSKSHHAEAGRGSGASADAAPPSDSRQRKREKHKSSKREKRRAEKAERVEPRLWEVDFLSQTGGDSGGEQPAGASFADALGGSDSAVKKKKKKSKSSSSSSKPSSSANSIAEPAPARPPTPPPAPPPPRLEVLDALPEISATYKPLPRAPAAAAAARPSGKRTLDQEEALAAVLGAKNKRTKVYSGARHAGWSRVPTLVDICLRSLQENIDYLEYTGGVPFDILRPVLEKCSAVQLRDIEYYNSYLLAETDGIWEQLVRKEFKTERRQEMETWREMHERCSEEREQKYNKLRSIIEGKRQESLASSRKTKVAYEHTVAKPPRNVARKQAKNGTAVAASLPAPTVLAGGGSRPPRPAPGADPTSRPAAPARNAAPAKKKAPLMAKVLRAMGRR